MKRILFLMFIMGFFLPLAAEDEREMELYRNLQDARELYQDAYDKGDFDNAMVHAEEVNKIAQELRDYLDSLNQSEPIVQAEPEPETEPEPEPEPEPTMNLIGGGTYQVVRGDTLWDISAKEDIYDDPYEWERIYDANKNVLNEPANPDLIHAGMVFDIPEIEVEE